MSNSERFHGPIEDPLAGDVDKFVHPDETRSDEQIAHDERVARNLHMSGDDGADEFWADYDEYFGTVNGGEQPEAKEDNSNPAEVPGTPEWHKAHTKTVIDVDGNEHRYFDLGPMFKDMSQTEIAEYLRQGKITREAEEKRQSYWDELDELEREGETEDPLADDVDRWVHPNETKD